MTNLETPLGILFCWLGTGPKFPLRLTEVFAHRWILWIQDGSLRSRQMGFQTVMKRCRLYNIHQKKICCIIDSWLYVPWFPVVMHMMFNLIIRVCNVNLFFVKEYRHVGSYWLIASCDCLIWQLRLVESITCALQQGVYNFVHSSFFLFEVLFSWKCPPYWLIFHPDHVFFWIIQMVLFTNMFLNDLKPSETSFLWFQTCFWSTNMTQTSARMRLVWDRGLATRLMLESNPPGGDEKWYPILKGLSKLTLHLRSFKGKHTESYIT